jgi:hypothetical protein
LQVIAPQRSTSVSQSYEGAIHYFDFSNDTATEDSWVQAAGSP